MNFALIPAINKGLSGLLECKVKIRKVKPGLFHASLIITMRGRNLPSDIHVLVMRILLPSLLCVPEMHAKV